MKKIIINIVFLLIALGVNAQSKKEMQVRYKQAKDSGDLNYVVFSESPKQKKEIKSITFSSSLTKLGGKVVLADGEKIKFEPGEVLVCQTEEAFYKLCKYAVNNPDRSSFTSTLMGEGLAIREYKGSINIYTLSVSYRNDLKKDYEFGYKNFYFYIIEYKNDGNLIPIMGVKGDVIEQIEKWVAKSNSALQIIKECKNKYGKYPVNSEGELKIIEAVKIYNKEVQDGKIID